jgi:hypothetical protein
VVYLDDASIKQRANSLLQYVGRHSSVTEICLQQQDVIGDAAYEFVGVVRIAIICQEAVLNGSTP